MKQAQRPHVLRRAQYPIGYRAPERRQAMIAIPTCASTRAAICEVYGIADAELRDKYKTKTITEARHVAMWFMREVIKMSYPEIGRELWRDSPTVISGIRRIERDVIRV